MTVPLPTIRDPRTTSLGGLLTVHDLPKRGERKRWTPLYKAIIAEAIKHNVLSLEEACDRYCMSAAELKRWVALLETHGVGSLTANNLQLTNPEKLDDVASLHDGQLSIDFKTQTVKLGECVLHFTPSQLRLLSILIRRAPMPVSRQDAYTLLFADTGSAPNFKILDVMICKMRKQLGDNAIETVWGRGWRWRGSTLTKESAMNILEYMMALNGLRAEQDAKFSHDLNEVIAAYNSARHESELENDPRLLAICEHWGRIFMPSSDEEGED